MVFRKKTTRFWAVFFLMSLFFWGRISADAAGVYLSPEEAEFLVRSVAAAAEGSMRIDGRDNIKVAASYAARVGIIATVLNRLVDPRFPNSIPQIIASDKTFSSTAPAAKISDYDIALTYAALDAALQGFDPTGGALYFSTPVDSVNRFSVTCEMEGYLFGVPPE